MSASSGISASPELAAAFADAVQSQSVRFLKVAIENESLVHRLSVPISSTFDQDLELLQGDDILEANVPAYVLAKLDPPSPDWISIFYVPDTAQVREKMLYASTRSSLLKSLGSSLFTDSIYATSRADLTPDAYAAHLKHVAAPNPLSSREQELSDLRAAEKEAASYTGSQARATHIGTGVGLGWSPGVEEALVELAEGSEDGVLVLAINTQAESLEVRSTATTSADDLSSQLPTAEPCYAFFAWNHSFKSSPVRELVFIYSCPSSSPIKHRMLYSSGSGAAYQSAKGILSERVPAVQIGSRKIEVSDPQEINHAYLQDELGYKSGADVQTDAPKRFAKPKGPREEVAVYCGSSLGTEKAYVRAATSLGHALAANKRTLVYGGGSKGIMGVVSGSVLEKGGDVLGVIPYAMVAAGGEKEQVKNAVTVDLNEAGRERVQTIVVDSMHERKVEMAKRVDGFVGLPGGYGTFEEVLEVTTWTQLGIHDKPVVLANVLGFWSPLRDLIKSGVNSGFIRPANESIIVFVDGPADFKDHESFDWGTAILNALDHWERGTSNPLFDWTQRKDNCQLGSDSGTLRAT